MHVYLTTNSPGEVATWVRPIVTELDRVGRSQGREIRISIFVTPCRYASGQETDVLATLPNVERVFSTRETAFYATTGRRPKGFTPHRPGVLLFLGGEIKLAAWLSRRLGVPGTVYTEGFINTAKAFERVYVPYERARTRAIRLGAPSERVHVVGNLMIDAVQPHVTTRQSAREGLGLDSKRPVVTFLPGSRSFEWRVLVPFYSQVLGQLRQRMPDLQAVMAVSPFASELQERYALHLTPGEPRLTQIEDESFVAVSNRSELAIQAADLVLTLPGSNTLEIAALKRPMVVSLPLYNPEEIPLDGLAGVIGSIPILGPRLKRYAVLRYSGRMPLAALPNMLAQREIAPELRGEKLQPWDVTTVAYELLMNDDVRGRVAMDLHSVVGSAGAARTIVSDILSLAMG